MVDEDDGGYAPRVWPAIVEPFNFLWVPVRLFWANLVFWILVATPELLGGDEVSLSGGWDAILAVAGMALSHAIFVERFLKNPYFLEVWVVQFRTGSGRFGRLNTAVRTRNGVPWRGNRYLPF